MREQFKFDTITDARAWSKKYDKMIYVELRGQRGVFQVYPGGRSIRWPDKPRYWGRLTPSEEFDHRPL